VGILNTPITELGVTMRSWAPTYGYTEITGETITSGVIKSADGDTYFDLKNNKIGGNIHFEDGLFSGLIEVGSKKGETNSGINGENDSEDPVRFWAGSDAQNKGIAPFRVTNDGKLIAKNAEIEGKIIATEGEFTGAVRSSNKGERIEIDPQSKSIMLITSNDETAGAFRFYSTSDGYGSQLTLSGNDDRSAYLTSYLLRYYNTKTQIELNLRNNSIYLEGNNMRFNARIGSYSLVMQMRGLPTSKIGLLSGDIWRDGEFVKIVP